MIRRICLFAHHDPSGAIAPHVAHYLRQLASCGYATHVALSGTDALAPPARAALEAAGATAHHRPNQGLDFGAWQALLDRGCGRGADEVLLANDSVFGPLQPLAPIFADMRARGADVWGMVESRERSWHLQSWFLCFTAAALGAPAVSRVLRQPFAQMGKDEIILHGELGLGAAIRADGLRWDARWRQPARRLRRLVAGNAMHLDFLSVVRCGAVPFIKVELLRRNPAAIAWVDAWRSLLAASPIFPAAWVERHLGAGYRAPRPEQSLRMRALQAVISQDQPDALRSLLGAARR